MNVITTNRFGYNDAPRACREVDPELIRALESKGFPRPIRSLSDPRLRLPELLLMNGWERSETKASVVYSNEAESDPSARQSVVFGPDCHRELITEVGDRRHVLRSMADGTVEEIKE